MLRNILALNCFSDQAADPASTFAWAQLTTSLQQQDPAEKDACHFLAQAAAGSKKQQKEGEEDTAHIGLWTEHVRGWPLSLSLPLSLYQSHDLHWCTGTLVVVGAICTII